MVSLQGCTIGLLFLAKSMREWIKQSVRFDIFNRDWFKCRYCGKSPEQGAKLQVDHVIPVAEWWGNEVENLVTACRECNIGKSKKLITSKMKNRDLVKEMKEMKEQVKILQKYYDFLRKKYHFERQNDELDIFIELSWREPIDFWKPEVRKLIKRYGMDIAIKAWGKFCDWRVRDVAYLFWIWKHMMEENLLSN